MIVRLKAWPSLDASLIAKGFNSMIVRLKGPQRLVAIVRKTHVSIL